MAELRKPRGVYITVTGTAGAADNAVIYTSVDVSEYNRHYIEATAGTIDVDASINGADWIETVAARDIQSSTPGTFVKEGGSGTCLEVSGVYKAIRVLQKGAVASNARISHGVD